MFILALGLLGGFLHLGRQQVDVLERGSAADIRSRLSGDHAEVRVRAGLDLGALQGDSRDVSIYAAHFSTEGLPLFTEPQRSQSGRVRNLRIHLEDFQLKGLRVEALDANIPDCRFDLMLAVRHKQVRLSKSGTGDGSVTIQAKDLEAFILRKFHEIKTVHVTLTKDQVTVEGHGEFMIVSTDFRVVAKLRPAGLRQLELHEARIEFDGQPADEASQKILLDTLNPVVDLDNDLGLCGAVDVEWVRLEPGKLKAGGKTRIPTAPNAKSPA